MEGENLRDWIEEEEEKRVEKGPMYRSIHDPDVSKVNSSFNPKHVGDGYEYGKRTKVKPALPDRSSFPTGTGMVKSKNFVLANAVEAILDGIEPRSKDSGINYLKKSDYGKVPEYLGKVKAEIEREKEAVRRVIRERELEEQRAKGHEYELDEAERLQLLDELKTKWGEYNAKYQKQAHLVKLDTAGKIQRKEYLEKMLARVEKAIQTLEKGPISIFNKPQ